jgi:hypothetical protein
MLGLPWTATHARRLAMTWSGIHAAGTLTVLDDWTPCHVAVVKIEGKLRGKWLTVRTTTRPDGKFGVTLRRGRVYRARVLGSARYYQTCGPALSTPLRSEPR